MKNKDLHWIAGIIDKGCAITAARNGKKFCIRVVMSSTNPEVAMKLHSLIKTGNIKIHKRKWTIKYHGATVSGKHRSIKDSYQYILCGLHAANFLEKVVPFLRTEKAQNKALLAIQLHEDHSRVTLRSLKKLGTRTKI